MKVFFIGLAGAAGSLTRYGIGLAVGSRSFPWATLAINLCGSFVLGLLVKLAIDHGWSSNVMAPLTVGFLGAYTTFSTFSVDAHTLLRTDRPLAASAYVIGSVAGGVAFAALGYLVAQAR